MARTTCRLTIFDSTHALPLRLHSFVVCLDKTIWKFIRGKNTTHNANEYCKHILSLPFCQTEKFWWKIFYGIWFRNFILKCISAENVNGMTHKCVMFTQSHNSILGRKFTNKCELLLCQLTTAMRMSVHDVWELFGHHLHPGAKYQSVLLGFIRTDLWITVATHSGSTILVFSYFALLITFHYPNITSVERKINAAAAYSNISWRFKHVINFFSCAFIFSIRSLVS